MGWEFVVALACGEHNTKMTSVFECELASDNRQFRGNRHGLDGLG